MSVPVRTGAFLHDKQTGKDMGLSKPKIDFVILEVLDRAAYYDELTDLRGCSQTALADHLWEELGSPDEEPTRKELLKDVKDALAKYKPEPPGYGDFLGDDGRYHCCQAHADTSFRCTQSKCDYEYHYRYDEGW